MKIIEKMPIIERSILSVSEHHDSDAAVRLAAMENIKAFCDEQTVAINAEVQAEIDAQGLGEG